MSLEAVLSELHDWLKRQVLELGGLQAGLCRDWTNFRFWSKAVFVDAFSQLGFDLLPASWSLPLCLSKSG